MIIIGAVIVVHAVAVAFGLYGVWHWFDIPMHFTGGFAMGALGLAIWKEGIEEVRFKGWMAKHLKWWLVPLFVVGFVSTIGILWEIQEFVLDVLVTGHPLRQPSIADTMADFALDLVGGATALIFYRK